MKLLLILILLLVNVIGIVVIVIVTAMLVVQLDQPLLERALYILDLDRLAVVSLDAVRILFLSSLSFVIDLERFSSVCLLIVVVF